MKQLHSLLPALALLTLALVSCGSETEPVPTDRPCYENLIPDDSGPRILFIGNSLTYWNDIPGILAGLMKEASAPYAAIDASLAPGLGLIDHWNNPNLHSLIERGWDVVVLQQGPSATEGRPSLLEYSERFAEEIRAAGGTPALFMVWPSKSLWERDIDGVSQSYADAAELVDGLLFPVGEAWRATWAREPDLALYTGDDFHPNELASYLAALVMFEQLTGMDLEEIGGEFCIPGLGNVVPHPGFVTVLKDAAAEANVNFAREPTGAQSRRK